jgi:hypothetical protein
MHGPAADRFERQVMVRQPLLQLGPQMRPDQIGDLGGQAHDEAVILNRPRHGLGAGGHQQGATGDTSPQPRGEPSAASGRVPRDQRSGRTSPRAIPRLAASVRLAAPSLRQRLPT